MWTDCLCDKVPVVLIVGVICALEIRHIGGDSLHNLLITRRGNQR
jgi:hypothetical protein